MVDKQDKRLLSPEELREVLDKWGKNPEVLRQMSKETGIGISVK